MINDLNTFIIYLPFFYITGAGNPPLNYNYEYLIV